jgi:cyanate permease
MSLLMGLRLNGISDHYDLVVVLAGLINTRPGFESAVLIFFMLDLHLWFGINKSDMSVLQCPGWLDY